MISPRIRRFLAFIGPATLVSVGYLDPGNWATDLEAGSKFGGGLLWVLVASNCLALLLQSLSARLGLVSGRDLAALCRLQYSPRVSIALWLLAELGIIACDMAEILGSAVALNLLFGLPLVAGAVLTIADVLLIMGFRRRATRTLPLIALVLLGTTGACLVIELLLTVPKTGSSAAAVLPTIGHESLLVAIGMLGATVMPHNLYLHSALVKESEFRERSPDAQRRALKRGTLGTALALNVALLFNAAILILAAVSFPVRTGEAPDLEAAHRLLAPLAGTGLASILFALGLLCSAQSATITGTLAGQVVMEGFVRLRLSPEGRRALTRGISVVPTVVILALVGDRATMPLLVISQVILSLQLPFAIVPLVRFTSATHLMGRFANGTRVKVFAWGATLLVSLANAALVTRTLQSMSSDTPWLAAVGVIAGLCALGLLTWISIAPLRGDRAYGRFGELLPREAQPLTTRSDVS